MRKELRIVNGRPKFTAGLTQKSEYGRPFYVKTNILRVLLANTELNVLNGFRSAPEGRVLGNVAVGQIADCSTNTRMFAQMPHIQAGMYVFISSHSPCFVCSNCQIQHWDECKNSQLLGVQTDGTATTDAYIPVMCLTPLPYVAPKDDRFNFQQFLMTEMVAKFIWLATQDFVRRDIKMGAAGRSFPIEMLSTIASDFSDVTVDKIHHVELGFGYSSASARYDVLIDYDGDTLTAENVVTLLKPGGVLVSPVNAARLNALEKMLNRISFKMLDFEQSSPFLAIEWIVQNAPMFQEKGASVPFNEQGLLEIKHHEVLREKSGFIYFDMTSVSVLTDNALAQVSDSVLANINAE